jgi:hypothetical protein
VLKNTTAGYRQRVKMSDLSFGPDGTSKCESCGEMYNSITSYDFSGRLCNKCNDAKNDIKKELEPETEQDTEQDEEQDEEKEPERDVFGFPVKATKKGKGKGMFGFGGM